MTPKSTTSTASSLLPVWVIATEAPALSRTLLSTRWSVGSKTAWPLRRSRPPASAQDLSSNGLFVRTLLSRSTPEGRGRSLASETRKGPEERHQSDSGQMTVWLTNARTRARFRSLMTVRCTGLRPTTAQLDGVVTYQTWLDQITQEPILPLITYTSSGKSFHFGRGTFRSNDRVHSQ